jgi:hypothetical protein
MNEVSNTSMKDRHDATHQNTISTMKQTQTTKHNQTTHTQTTKHKHITHASTNTTMAQNLNTTTIATTTKTATATTTTT